MAAGVLGVCAGRRAGQEPFRRTFVIFKCQRGNYREVCAPCDHKFASEEIRGAKTERKRLRKGSKCSYFVYGVSLLYVFRFRAS